MKQCNKRKSKHQAEKQRNHFFCQPEILRNAYKELAVIQRIVDHRYTFGNKKANSRSPLLSLANILALDQKILLNSLEWGLFDMLLRAFRIISLLHYKKKIRAIAHDAHKAFPKPVGYQPISHIVY